jgi:DNA polymerase-1
MQHKICLLDGSGFIFRAFHALPPMYSNDGIPVNAVYGFVKSILALIEEKNFDHIAVIFDHKSPTFRSQIYPLYKAQRPPLPPELAPQFELIYEATKCLNIQSETIEGFEADDIIATYVKIAKALNWEVEIISSDKDLMQLIDDSANIYMYDAIKRKKITSIEVLEKFGVSPTQVIEVQAIVGDAVDNIPGVKGIGIKGATSLIQDFGSIENLYNNLDKVKPALKEKLITHKGDALMSLNLVKLKEDVPSVKDIDNFKIQEIEPKILYDFLNKLSFKSLATKISNKYGLSQNFSDENVEKNHNLAEDLIQNHTFNVENIKLMQLNNSADIKLILPKLLENNKVSFANTQDNTIQFYDEKNHSYYRIAYSNKDENLFNEQPNLADILAIFKELFENPAILKIGYNIKDILKILYNLQIKPVSYEDMMLIPYLNGQYNLEYHHLNLDILNQYQISIPNYPACEIHLAYGIFASNLIENKNKYLYEILDKPLIEVLAIMENNGILVDAKILADLSITYGSNLDDLQNQAHQLAGVEFNLASPKQVGEILFEKLALKGKKTKAGSWKTDIDVLESLAEDDGIGAKIGAELANILIQHRQIAKLKNTYSDKLPLNINPLSKRIHSNFLQCSTLTGRLSSIDPNLQNIPIKTPLGQQIRRAFVAKSGYKIISLDYSQIELRVLSIVANVDNLITAFKNNEDIHSKTASEIFHIPLDKVDKDHRRKAKAINFGIIYGQSMYGLAKTLNIPKEEARDYIDKYFIQYPQIKSYMDNTIASATQDGFVSTIFNRKCFIDNINSSNFNIRALAQRSAINAPIQGSASDIMRLSLIAVHNFIKKNNLECKIVLQIHDEILIEAKEQDAQIIAKELKKVMENILINNPYNLAIPLSVNFDIGNNWLDSH